jgi:hypothetical protein
MTKLVSLFSKKFTGEQVESSFVAKSSKLTMIVEKRENISSISILLKGRKELISIRSIFTSTALSSIINFDLIEGETYQVTCASAQEKIKGKDDVFIDKHSTIEISGHWGSNND